MSKLLRILVEMTTAIGWVLAALLFALFSVAVVVGIAWLVRLAFPFLPNFAIILVLPAALAIYLFTVGWIAWKILRSRMRI